MMTQTSIKWDGEEIIDRGMNKGTAWKDLSLNSLDYYADWRNAQKIPKEWAQKARLEIDRQKAELKA